MEGQVESVKRRNRQRVYDASIRNMRVSARVKAGVLRIARRRRVSVSQVVRDALEAFVADQP